MLFKEKRLKIAANSCQGDKLLTAYIQWIFLNPDVKCVIADTIKNNIPSHRVLQKIGMVVYKEDDECIWWKLKK
ncbi:GNAT family N-acetyltransferase [Clostridium sp. FP2]|uniref:GNAT family N-acetyltransferase n=1 Tax=Clostridium sp. FP2 TaxID=2724481 RepID=UPI0013E93374|nr:GNAT family protein [Clostridium sp. FP2]MBZ9623667.1 GNAT family N-acetyltransferase [Clostridium sp. FP2]